MGGGIRVYLAMNGAMLVLFLHILAATVWIGGQVTLAVLVPLLRGVEGMPTAAARRFQYLAWSAYAVLILTGIANVRNAGIGWSDLESTPAGRTLSLKLVLVIVSGVGAAVHAYSVGPRATRSGSRRFHTISGIFAGISLLAAIGAALYGVDIAEH
jgi:putative copper export protein